MGIGMHLWAANIYCATLACANVTQLTTGMYPSIQPLVAYHSEGRIRVLCASQFFVRPHHTTKESFVPDVLGALNLI